MRTAAAAMMISLMPLVISFLILPAQRFHSLLQLIQQIASQCIWKSESSVVTGAAIALIGHPNVGQLPGLVYRLVALNAQEVGRPLNLILYFPSWANIPFVVNVAELANLREVRGFRATGLVALLAIVHVRKVFAGSRFRLHPVTLKAGRVSFFDSQLILAGTRVLDPLMTIGAPCALTGRKLGRRNVGRPGSDWLELEAGG